MSKHTPAPWILATVPTSVGSCHKIGPFPNGDRVATFACVYADGHRLGIDDGNAAAVELAANARLIAAAPDLLEALQALDACYCEASDDMSRAQRAHHRQVLISARAAIAKATGSTE